MSSIIESASAFGSKIIDNAVAPIRGNLPSNAIKVDFTTMGNFLGQQLTSVFQKSTTSLLGGELPQSELRQTLNSINATAQALGIDSPPLRDVLNSISGFTGIKLNAPPKVLTPTVFLTAVVKGATYKFEMFDTDDELDFKESVNWSDVDIVGRPSPVFSYRNSSATEYTLNGFLKVDSKDNIADWNSNMKNLRAMKYPVQFALGVAAPPIWLLEIYAPYSTARVYGPVKVRVNAVSWQYLKPFIVSGAEGAESAVPVITKVSLDIREVEDLLSGSQVSYYDQLFNTKASELQSFNFKAVSNSQRKTTPANSSNAIDTFVDSAFKSVFK